MLLTLLDLPLSPVRALIAIALVAILPGYALVTSIFVNVPLGIMEKIAFSFGFSLGMTSLGGLLLNYTPWGIQPVSWVVLLGGVSLIASGITLLRINDIKDASGNGIGAAFAKQGSITKPADTVLILDGWPEQSKPSKDEERHEIGWVWGNRNARLNSLDDGNPRHTGGFNLVLCDGHAKWRNREKKNSTFTGGTKDVEWQADQP